MVRATGAAAARRVQAGRPVPVGEVAERGDEGRHVGQRGGVEHAVHPGRFPAGLDHAHLLEDDLGAFRGVELDRQRDELEEGQHAVADDAEGDQTRDVKHETADDDQREDLRGELRDRDDGHAPFERRVGARMLDGVAGFVRGDAQRGHAWRAVDVGRQTEPLFDRIVMVAEHVVDLADLDIVDLRGVEDFARGLRSGHSGSRGDFLVSAERGRNAHLGVKTEDKRNSDQQQVGGHAHGGFRSSPQTTNAQFRSKVFYSSRGTDRRESCWQPERVTATTSSCRAPPSPG